MGLGVLVATVSAGARVSQKSLSSWRRPRRLLGTVAFGNVGVGCALNECDHES